MRLRLPRNLFALTVFEPHGEPHIALLQVFELVRYLALDAVSTSDGAARLGARSPIRTGRRSHGEGSVALAA